MGSNPIVLTNFASNPNGEGTVGYAVSYIEYINMNTCDKGVLGEAKTIARLVELGYGVFLPLSGHAPFDIIAVSKIDNKTIRISCKACYSSNKNGSFDFSLRQITPNTKGCNIKLFDTMDCDLIACYIAPLDKVCFVNSKDIESKSTITFREVESKFSNTGKSRVISNYLIPTI